MVHFRYLSCWVLVARAAPNVSGISIELQPMCFMKYVLMSTTSVMERHPSHLEDIDLMAFSRTGLRILAAEDMTISADFITTYNLCFCALVRQNRSDLQIF